MKPASAVTALVLLGFAMPVAAECSSSHPSASASATPPSQLAATPVPAATNAPTSAASKVPALKAAAKPVADKNKENRAGREGRGRLDQVVVAAIPPKGPPSAGLFVRSARSSSSRR